MSTSTTHLTHTDLRMGITPAGSRPDPEAWKKMMGQKPVAARLGLLPERKVSRSALLTSTAFQLLLAAFVVALPVFFPQRLITKIVYEVTPLATPQTEVLLPPKPPVVQAKVHPAPPLPQPKPEEIPEPPQRVARLIAPKTLVAPKLRPVETKHAELPQLSEALAETKFE